jgi:hypothetical protein
MSAILLFAEFSIFSFLIVAADGSEAAFTEYLTV